MLTRFKDWWIYKIPPLLTLAFATNLLMGQELWLSIPNIFKILFSLIAGGIYAYLINDFSDQGEDAKAQKKNAFLNKSLLQRRLMLAGSAFLVLVALWFWTDAPELLALYVFNYLLFALYSLRPFRLKERGFWGVLVGGVADTVLPSLFVVGALAQKNYGLIPFAWWIAIFVWSLALGIKYMAGHQMQDLPNDLVTNTRTWLRKKGIQKVNRIIQYRIFPLEIIGLAMLIWVIPSYLPLAFLIVQLITEILRSRAFKRKLTVIEPLENNNIWLQEFYELFLPLALLTQLALNDINNGLVLIVYAVLFYPRIVQFFREMSYLV